MTDKKKPLLVSALAGDSNRGSKNEILDFGERIARYGIAKQRAEGMKHFLTTEFLNAPQFDDRAAVAGAKLAGCGNYLVFNEYYTVGKIRLTQASFCKQHLICPLCAIRRGAKSMGSYLDKWQVTKKENPGLKLSLVTLTVKNGPDLKERQNHLDKSLKKYLRKRSDYAWGKRDAAKTELNKAAGAVYTKEITNKGQGWHPHVHMLVASKEPIDQYALSREWKAITGDSFIVDSRPVYGDPIDSFCEVFKYAVKFSDLSYSDNWQAACVLKGRRLLGSFGCFFGVKVPEALTDELLEDLPFITRLYRYLNGHYNVVSVTSPQSSFNPYP